MKKTIDLDDLQNHWLIVVDGEEHKVVYEVDDERIFSSKITGLGRGCRSALISHKTFKDSKVKADKGIKYLDTCHFSCKFKIIQVKDLDSKGLKFLKEDIDSFNRDASYHNDLEIESKLSEKRQKYKDDNEPGCWIVFSVDNEYNQPYKAFEGLYWEKPTYQYLEENYSHLHNWWVEKFNKYS
jgi:hypothetical protein